MRALFTKDDNNQSRSSETLDEMMAQRSADAGAELAEGKAPPPPAADFPRVRPRREKNEDNDEGSVSAGLFQPYFVPEEKRFRRRTLARENHCKRLIRSKSRGNSSRIIHQLHAA